MARRIEQVNELLRSEIALAIERDLDLDNVLATVTHVRCAVDLTSAKIWISILPDNKAGSAMKDIKNGQSLIYRALKKNTVLNKIPRLEFIFDDTQKKAALVQEVINSME